MSGLTAPSRAVAGGLMDWYLANGRHQLPWRTRQTAYTVLVSEFMLQQTQVDRVVPKFRSWLRQFPGFARLAEASLDDVYQAWDGLGYYRRAKSLHELAKSLELRRASRQPLLEDMTQADLQELPGVGPYTAAALASFAFNRAEPAIDTNVRRVALRLMGLHGPVGNPGTQNDTEVRDWVFSLMKGRQPREVMAALMDFGALVCNAKSPDCGHCPLRRSCRGMRLEPSVMASESDPARRKNRDSSAPTHAIGLIRDNLTLLLPRGSQVPIVDLKTDGAASDPRKAIKLHYLSQHQLPVAVRPEHARIQIRDNVVSLHRCSILRTEAPSFKPVSQSQVGKCAMEIRMAAAAMGLRCQDGTPIVLPAPRPNAAKKSSSKRV